MSAFSILPLRECGQDNRYDPTEPCPGHKSLFLKRHRPAKKPEPCGHSQGGDEDQEEGNQEAHQAIDTSLAANTCNPSVKNMVTCISQASPWSKHKIFYWQVKNPALPGGAFKCGFP